LGATSISDYMTLIQRVTSLRCAGTSELRNVPI